MWEPEVIERLTSKVNQALASPLPTSNTTCTAITHQSQIHFFSIHTPTLAYVNNEVAIFDAESSQFILPK